MSRDLEETLDELGPGYRAVVDRLKGAYEPRCREVRLPAAPPRPSFGRVTGWGVGYLVAASLLVFVALGVLFRSPRPAESRLYTVGVAPSVSAYTLAYVSDAQAIGAIVATQRPDGSWANDFVTRQNAAALRGESGPSARVAYKKAVRYLRSRGLRPLSDGELRSRGDAAARELDRI